MKGRHHHHHPKIHREGELFVTGEGEIIIEESLRRSRGLLAHSEEFVSVQFLPSTTPVCNPDVPDDLEWCAIERESMGELFLKIKWRVSSARVIEWRVFEVD